ncbi:MAG: hypothetical protein EOP45_21105 [Sphingobacteriaceae bacterium]|nr:MAG: hypothetical protein EOP45_21105 [Sphingobacteriaceae bacterium]
MNNAFNMQSTASLSSDTIARMRTAQGVNNSVSGINNPSYRERAAAADRMRESERDMQAKREAAEREKSKNRWSFTPPSSSSSTTSSSSFNPFETSSTSSFTQGSGIRSTSSSKNNNNAGSKGFAAKYVNTTKDQSFTAKEAAKKKSSSGGSDDESDNSGKISPRSKRKADAQQNSSSSGQFGDNSVKDNKMPWLLWSQYLKKTFEGKEYAVIANRLYTRHAVESMYPRTLGKPIGNTSDHDPVSVPPSFVEHILKDHTTKTWTSYSKEGVERVIYDSNDVRITTENKGKLIVSVARVS